MATKTPPTSYYRGSSDVVELRDLSEESPTVQARLDASQAISFKDIMLQVHRYDSAKTDEARAAAQQKLEAYKKRIIEEAITHIGENENAVAGAVGKPTSFVSYSTNESKAMEFAGATGTSFIITAVVDSSYCNVYETNVNKAIPEQVDEYFAYLMKNKPKNTVYPIFHGNTSEYEVLLPSGLNLDQDRSTLKPLNANVSSDLGIQEGSSVRLIQSEELINKLIENKLPQNVRARADAKALREMADDVTDEILAAQPRNSTRGDFKTVLLPEVSIPSKQGSQSWVDRATKDNISQKPQRQ